MKDSTGNDLESVTQPGDMAQSPYCLPRSAGDAAWDAHCERHHKNERELRGHVARLENALDKAGHACTIQANDMGRFVKERDTALGKVADAERRANDLEGKWRDDIVTAREACDAADRKLEVAELQYRELLRASALLSAAVATSGDIHEAVDKLAQVVENHKTNGGRLEDVLVPLCMGCETSVNMEKTWRCKRCSPDKFEIQR